MYKDRGMVVWKVCGAVKQGAVSALTLLLIFVADTKYYLDRIGGRCATGRLRKVFC